MDQNQTPLLHTLLSNAVRPHAPFYTPGHKRGVGVSQLLTDAFGKNVFRADLTELTELDNLFAPSSVIQQAQQLAAELFGATYTWFLVNGSTCGIEAAILATCGNGDKIILPRNVHSSAISGLILSGAIPIFLNPEYDPVLDIAHGITPQTIQTVLEKHPDAKAVMIVYPTYHGVCTDVSAIARITHQYNIPLLVDEAHGAHFAFHPELPISALAAGADLTVQSIHKTLGAMTQTAMLHVQGDRIDIDRISKALQLVQSTSPSYILLASLDAARQQMALHGNELMSRALKLADEARNRIQQIPRLSLLCCDDVNFMALDKTRLTVIVSKLGLTGFEADEMLEQIGVTCEFPSLQHLTFIISLGNTHEDIEQLVQSLTKIAVAPTLSASKQTESHSKISLTNISFGNTMGISPREAFFAPTRILPIEEATSHICAEVVCPYPPGIPILMPGEIISKIALEYLQQVQIVGGFVTGCVDNTLNTLKVVKE
jgi:arginine decarboxylase